MVRRNRAFGDFHYDRRLLICVHLRHLVRTELRSRRQYINPASFPETTLLFSIESSYLSLQLKMVAATVHVLLSGLPKTTLVPRGVRLGLFAFS
jgi:hypothetical protein